MSVGERTADILWEARTKGTLPFVADIELPGMLTAAVLRSPHPHAEIRSLDTAEAEAMPGVAAVVTYADLPDAVYPHDGPFFADRRPLAKDRVRFVGQEVAAVAAETREQARAAVAAIRVRYRRLRPVLTVDEALAERAPLLHDRTMGANVALRIDRTFGDPEGSRRRGDVTVSGRYVFGRQAHACMETNGTVASWDAEAGHLDMWTSTQSPRLIRKEVAAVLGIDPHRIRMHEVAVGGGFGSKSKITDHEVIAAALAMKAGRPVRLVLSRDEEFATTKSRHEFRVDLTTSARPSGELVGRDADMVVDNGAYSHSGPSVTGASVGTMASLYRTEAARIRARLVDTNKNPGGQFRGYGSPQVLFAIESQMDELADELNVDPIDLRIRNANRAGDVTHAGWQIVSAGLVECLETVRREIDWDRKRALGGSGRGVGVAAALHVTGARTYEDANRAEAGVDVATDGRVRVRFGGSDAGTGQRTVLAQVVADELGIEPSSVEVVMMDTAETPFDLGAWSSRGTFMAGHAAGAAAASTAERLRAVAAEKFGVDPSDVVLAGGTAAAGADIAGIGDLAALVAEDGWMRTESEFVTDSELVNRETGRANVSPTYSFAAHAVEVEVDAGTGEIKVLDYVAAHDSGAAINPLALEGQIIGGVAMGLGAALGEQLLYEGGRMINPSYLHYALPRAADVPVIRPVVVDVADPKGPHGAKSIGEISLNPVPAAVANAVAHAIGTRIHELPLTPDRVVAAIRARDGAPARSFSLWRRPGRWWIHLVRWLYPRGLHAVLHRWGTKLGRRARPRSVTGLERPVDLAPAVALAAGEDAAIVAGGTDLLPAIDQGLAAPVRLVDVTMVGGLAEVTEAADGGLHIGASVTLADLGRAVAGGPDLVVADTVGRIASAQIREMATVAGNLLQQKRCWFYRSGFDCYKRAGATAPCYAVDGDNRFYHAVLGAHRCQAVTPSDLATTLTALDASLRVVGPGGSAVVPIAELYTGPGETRLGHGQIVTRIDIPAAARRRESRFDKIRLWEGDFAVASVCVSLRRGGDGRVADSRVVLGGIAPTPYRARRVEAALAGNRLTPAVTRRAAEAWVPGADPLRGNAWKVDAASSLLARVLSSFPESGPSVESKPDHGSDV